MGREISVILKKMNEVYHLREINPENSSFSCGKLFQLDDQGAYGRCWFYESTPYTALLYLDVSFDQEFEFVTKVLDCAYISFFSRLYNAKSIMDGEEFTMEKNTLYTNLFPFERKYTRFSSGSSLQGILLLFIPEHFQEQLAQYTGTTIHLNQLKTHCGMGHMSVASVPLIIRQILGCRIQDSEHLARIYFDSKIRELLALFLDALSSPQQESDAASFTDPESRQIKDDDLHQIIILVRYLKEHPGEETNLNSLTSIAHMSIRKMTTVFKTVTGMTIREYRNHIRMDLAKKMLTDQNNTVSDIAEYLGFASTSSFTSFFKRQTGLSPRQYRTN